MVAVSSIPPGRRGAKGARSSAGCSGRAEGVERHPWSIFQIVELVD